MTMPNLPASVATACGAVDQLAEDTIAIADALAVAFGVDLPTVPYRPSGSGTIITSVTRLADALDAIAITAEAGSARLRATSQPTPIEARPDAIQSTPCVCPPHEETITTPPEVPDDADDCGTDSIIYRPITPPGPIGIAAEDAEVTTKLVSDDQRKRRNRKKG